MLPGRDVQANAADGASDCLAAVDEVLWRDDVLDDVRRASYRSDPKSEWSELWSESDSYDEARGAVESMIEVLAPTSEPQPGPFLSAAQGVRTSSQVGNVT